MLGSSRKSCRGAPRVLLNETGSWASNSVAHQTNSGELQMKMIGMRYVAAMLALGAAACMDLSGPDSTLLSLTDAFEVLPAGFTANNTSFGEGDASEPAFAPHMARGREHGGPGRGGLMGGGFGPDFLGGIALGRGFGRGPFGGGPLSSDCTFSASTGRVTCAADVRNGITINRSFSFATAAGVVQPRPDSTTNTVNSQVTVSGTRTRRDSAVSTITSSSNRTVSGLAHNATQRTVNGTSSGTETTTGRVSEGAFTATRVVGDTTTGIVIPIVDGRPTYPTAGTVVRRMKVSLTLAGATTVKDRREVVTYNGSATASLVITQDGTTKTCTLPLPRGKPSCS